jgi:hypothetical protein
MEAPGKILLTMLEGTYMGALDIAEQAAADPDALAADRDSSIHILTNLGAALDEFIGWNLAGWDTPQNDRQGRAAMVYLTNLVEAVARQGRYATSDVAIPNIRRTLQEIRALDNARMYDVNQMGMIYVPRRPQKRERSP